MGIGERGVKTILHLGDFGIWPGPSGKTFLQSVDRACERAGVEQILLTPGNHEDWGRLTQMWSLPKYRDPETGDPLPLPLSDHVAVLPRGYVFELQIDTGDPAAGTRRFLSLGGAKSVDRDQRSEGKDWWPEERFTQEDIDRAVRNGSRVHSQVDVLLTHESPERPYMVPAVETIIHGDAGEYTWPPEPLADAAIDRGRLSTVVEAVRPRLVAHGHMHVAGETTVQIPGAEHETRIWAIGKDGSASNVRYLDLATLSDPDWAR